MGCIPPRLDSLLHMGLSKVQRLACLCITGAMGTCSTAAMEVRLDLTPLHLTVQGAAEAALFRMAKNGVGGGLLVSRRALISLSKSIPHLMYPKEETNTRESGPMNVTYSLGEHTIKWYADGSKTHKETGAGVFESRTKYSNG